MEEKVYVWYEHTTIAHIKDVCFSGTKEECQAYMKENCPIQSVFYGCFTNIRKNYDYWLGDKNAKLIRQ